MSLDDTMDEGAATLAGPSHLPLSYARSGQTWFRRTLIRCVERFSGQLTLERLYRDWAANERPPGIPPFASALRTLRVEASLSAGELERIPATGGVLVLSNHPFGILDGLLVGDVIARVRPDLKIMTHSLLCQPPEAQGVLLPVDFADTPQARRTSLETRRQAVDWLAAGHVLIVFPAGSVSTAPAPLSAHAVDAAWHPFVVRLSAAEGVRTLPVFVHGQNSRLFQIASHVSYPLRVALILRETVRRIGGRVRVSVGEAVVVRPTSDRASEAALLRARSYALAGEGGPDGKAVFVWPRHIRW